MAGLQVKAFLQEMRRDEKEAAGRDRLVWKRLQDG